MLALALHVPLVACRNRGISSATTTNCCANITHTPCVSCAACMLERRFVRRVMRCVALRCVWHFQVPLIDVPHMRLPVANDTPPLPTRSPTGFSIPLPSLFLFSSCWHRHCVQLLQSCCFLVLQLLQIATLRIRRVLLE